MRHERRLDSVRNGIVRFDVDLLLHKYKQEIDGKGCRDIQCMMFIEIKTHMAKLTSAQQDTLSLLNQVLRNRRHNIHSTARRQIRGQVQKAWSKIFKREISLKMYGGHLLQMDGTDPDNSTTMKWDGKLIDRRKLIEVLTFDCDPDRVNLRIDHRRRSQSVMSFKKDVLPFVTENKEAT